MTISTFWIHLRKIKSCRKIRIRLEQEIFLIGNLIFPMWIAIENENMYFQLLTTHDLGAAPDDQHGQWQCERWPRRIIQTFIRFGNLVNRMSAGAGAAASVAAPDEPCKVPLIEDNADGCTANQILTEPKGTMEAEPALGGLRAAVTHDLFSVES